MGAEISALADFIDYTPFGRGIRTVKAGESIYYYDGIFQSKAVARSGLSVEF